jgi:hypothetical protein
MAACKISSSLRVPEKSIAVPRGYERAAAPTLSDLYPCGKRNELRQMGKTDPVSLEFNLDLTASDV